MSWRAFALPLPCRFRITTGAAIVATASFVRCTEDGDTALFCHPHPIETLLTWVKSGEIAIPEIQRPFVWEATKVRNLLDSLYQGYPVGYLIAWRNPTVRLKDGTTSAGKRILIDGQQRVTALMAALLGARGADQGLRNRPHPHRLSPAEERFEVSNPAIRKDAAWIEDVAEVFAPDASLTRADRRLSRAESRTPTKRVSRVLERLRKIINNHVGVIELAEDLDIETVTEIFIRVNSAGTSSQPSRLRHVEDRRQRDLWRQPAAQGDRLLLPPRGRSGVSGAHREGRQGVRRLRVFAARCAG